MVQHTNQRKTLGWCIMPHGRVAHWWRALTGGRQAVSRCFATCDVLMLRSAPDAPKCVECATMIDRLPEIGGDES